MTALPPAPPEEDARDACCAECGSLFHRTSEHAAPASQTISAVVGGIVDNASTINASIAHAETEFPPGYDPAEADRLIGRDPQQKETP